MGPKRAAQSMEMEPMGLQDSLVAGRGRGEVIHMDQRNSGLSSL